MDQNFFKIGDVVVVKSAGPRMTVTYIPPESRIDKRVQCYWFNGGDLNKGDFHQNSLTLIPEDK